MSSTGRGGPLTDFMKNAGFFDAARAGAGVAGRGLSAMGRGVWHAAGRLAPNPWARGALLATTALGVGTQVPHLAGRISQDTRYVRGEGPAVRGF